MGLGIQFLKHLSRTGLLLHVIDVAPFDGTDPTETAQAIIAELAKYDSDLVNKPRWLVLNKVDLLSDEAAEEACAKIIRDLNWQGPVYRISALSKLGTEQLCYDLMQTLEETAADDQ